MSRMNYQRHRNKISRAHGDAISGSIVARAKSLRIKPVETITLGDGGLDARILQLDEVKRRLLARPRGGK